MGEHLALLSQNPKRLLVLSLTSLNFQLHNFVKVLHDRGSDRVGHKSIFQVVNLHLAHKFIVLNVHGVQVDIPAQVNLNSILHRVETCLPKVVKHLILMLVKSVTV